MTTLKTAARDTNTISGLSKLRIRRTNHIHMILYSELVFTHMSPSFSCSRGQEQERPWEQGWGIVQLQKTINYITLSPWLSANSLIIYNPVIYIVSENIVIEKQGAIPENWA